MGVTPSMRQSIVFRQEEANINTFVRKIVSCVKLRLLDIYNSIDWARWSML